MGNCVRRTSVTPKRVTRLLILRKSMTHSRAGEHPFPAEVVPEDAGGRLGRRVMVAAFLRGEERHRSECATYDLTRSSLNRWICMNLPSGVRSRTWFLIRDSPHLYPFDNPNAGSRMQIVAGTVDYVSPVTDAESSTVRVKIKVPNPDGKFRSGEHCTLKMISPTRRLSQRSR